MDYVKNPKAIEDKSMEIIYDYVKDLGLTDDEVRVVSRTVHACLIKDENVAKMAKELGVTRSIAAMRTFGKQLEGQIVAIGNAPTALYEVLRLALEEGIKPALIIGIPVGFVGAAESKDYLMEVSPVPYITVKGNKGGSPIAASVCNALLYTDVKRNDMLFVEGKESK
ncbi:MAG: precorrin-8X methylmutase [Veillonella sp.]|nr:precorrin-8X methylmutase [Veillonella sp.]